jgi:hypothetical protein
MVKINMAGILLSDADRCMDAYESGADRSETRLSLAKVQIEGAYSRGVDVDRQLIRMVNIYRELGARGE